MTAAPPQDPLARLIYFTAQEIHNQAKKILQPLDITLEQFHTLKILVIANDLTQCQLCREANKSAANMTRLLDRLEKKGLLTRRTNPSDRRAALVTLTDKGRALVTEAREVLVAFAARMNQGLTPIDEGAVRVALQTISANLRVLAKTPQGQDDRTATPSQRGSR